MTETVRTTADMLTRMGDSAAAHSTNREMIRDIVKSFDITRSAIVNVKDAPYNAVGDGSHDDTTAIQTAINTGLPTLIPAGTYKVTSPLSHAANDQVIMGAGIGHTTIVPTGAGVHAFQESPTLTYTRVTIEKMSIIGDSSSGCGIYFPTKLTYMTALRDLYIYTGGDAVQMLNEFSTVIERVKANSYTGHGFFLNGGNTTHLIGCYASQIPNGKYGYRIYGGAVLTSCNGVDAGTNWGMFGATVANDGVNAIFNVLFKRCNIEAFTDIGIRFLFQGYAEFDGGTFTKTSGNYTCSISVEASNSEIRLNGPAFFTSGGTKSKLSDVFASAVGTPITASSQTLLTCNKVDENGSLRDIPTYTTHFINWTPVLAGSSTAGTNTYTTQSGKYRVDGQMVTAWFKIQLSGNSVAMTGNLRITGLPFTANASAPVSGGGSPIRYDFLTFTAGYTQLGFEVVSGTTTIWLFQTGSNVAAAQIAVANIGASTGVLEGVVSYIR